MINNIQALRAFAALSVVLLHIFGHTAQHAGDGSVIADFFENWGNCGVDVFFVISGFIMVYMQHKNPKSAAEFIKNRAKKIIPLYWSVSLVFVLLLVLLPSAFRHATFDWKHSLTSFLFVSRAFGFNFPILDPGWTLEYEMFFYILFGLSLSIKKISTMLSVPFILLAGVLFTDLNPIVLEFAFGMLAGLFYVKGWLKRHGPLLFLIGATAILSTLLYPVEMTRVLRFGVPAFFLVIGCCYMPQIQNKPLILIGSASYSIYIIQTITLPVFYKIIAFANVPILTLGPDVITAACMIFTTLVGILVYQFYEKPVERILK